MALSSPFRAARSAASRSSYSTIPLISAGQASGMSGRHGDEAAVWLTLSPDPWADPAVAPMAIRRSFLPEASREWQSNDGGVGSPPPSPPASEERHDPGSYRPR